MGKMKAEHWILGVGALFAVAVMGAALMPDDPWRDDVPAAAAGLADIAGSGGGMVPSIATIPGVSALDGSPSTARARPVAMTGLTPFSRAESRRFDGRVVRVVKRGADVGWGQVHVWIAGGPDPVQEVSLAPDWFLQHLGCVVPKDARVRGMGFRFDVTRPGAELYARTVTVNGKTCRLRNDEGFALWSNKLR